MGGTAGGPKGPDDDGDMLPTSTSQAPYTIEGVVGGTREFARGTIAASGKRGRLARGVVWLILLPFLIGIVSTVVIVLRRLL